MKSTAALPARVLSQGQRRRVGLARLFLSADRLLWVLEAAALPPNATVDADMGYVTGLPLIVKGNNNEFRSIAVKALADPATGCSM